MFLRDPLLTLSRLVTLSGAVCLSEKDNKFRLALPQEVGMAGSYLGRSISLTGVVDSYLGSVRERRITGAVQVVFTRGRLRTQLRRVNQVDLGSESGQMFPVIAVLALVILATGVVIFWLGSATVQATSAQTAADAAALADGSRSSTPPPPSARR
jgi:hypothetical protein